MPVTTYTTIQGEIVSENRNGVKRDYLPDPLGNTIALLDANQQKTDTFSYWPYGELKSRTGTTPTPFQFGGSRGYHRSTSKRLYSRARSLDAERGRWITPDPLAQLLGGNHYAYVRNAPTRALDPSGLEPISFGVALVIILVAGGIAAYASHPPPPPQPDYYAWHGNYCGPEFRKRPLTGVGWIDEVDKCCMIHDADYLRDDCHFPGSYSRAECRQSDVKFCTCLWYADCKGDLPCDMARWAALDLFCPSGLVDDLCATWKWLTGGGWLP